MEARAHHFAVGVFVLALASALVAFTVWVAKVELTDRRPPYYIYFTGAVTGLKEGSSVRYRGILVGTVAEIRIDPANGEQVRVKVSLDADTPLKSDAVAAVEMSGLTGNAFIQITGGTRNAPPFTRTPDRIPVIASKPSNLAAVFESAPQIAHQLTVIGDRLTRLLSEDNERRVGATLDNLHQMSASLAASAREVGETMALVRATAGHLDGLMSEVRRHAAGMAGSAEATLLHVRSTLESLNGHANVAMGEAVRTSTEARSLSQSVRELSEQLSALIRENRVPVRDFTSVGLYELSLLISEMRELTVSLSRVSSEIEKGPVGFLFTGTRREEDKPK